MTGGHSAIMSILGSDRDVDYIDPAIRDDSEARRALAERDVTAIYGQLAASGVSQHQITRLTGQSQSVVSEILTGRQVKQYDTP